MTFLYVWMAASSGAFVFWIIYAIKHRFIALGRDVSNKHAEQMRAIGKLRREPRCCPRCKCVRGYAYCARCGWHLDGGDHIPMEVVNAETGELVIIRESEFDHAKHILPPMWRDSNMAKFLSPLKRAEYYILTKEQS